MAELSATEKEFDLMDILPTAQAQANLIKRMAVLVSRVITKYLKAFSSLKGIVQYHIPHAYSKEMEEKSNSVSFFNTF